MVCEKCQLKLKRLITPDVAKKPIYQNPTTQKFKGPTIQSQPSGPPKISEDTIEFDKEDLIGKITEAPERAL